MEENTEQRVDLTLFSGKIQELKDQIASVIVGQEQTVDLVLTAILANGHVLIEGVPGVAKTLLARLTARLIDADFSRIQFTPDLMPSDVLGTTVFNMKTNEFDFHQGPIFADIVLVDEINRAPAKTQAALFEVMEERQISIDGITHKMGELYTILATQNPVEQEGTYKLPEAQLDRFLLCLSMGYPDRESQVELMKERHHADPLAQVRPVTDAAALGGLMDAAAMTFVADPVYDYTARLLEATRCHESLQLGLSPRAGLALCRAAKARAFLHARDYVLPEDVAEAAPDVCAHRLVLAPRARLHDETARSVLAEILERVPQPAVREFKS